MVNALLLAAIAASRSSLAAEDAQVLMQVIGKSFHYSIAFLPSGPAGHTWQNLAAGSSLDLGFGPEIVLEVGESADDARKVSLAPFDAPVLGKSRNKAMLRMRSTDGGLAADLTYD